MDRSDQSGWRGKGKGKGKGKKSGTKMCEEWMHPAFTLCMLCKTLCTITIYIHTERDMLWQPEPSSLGFASMRLNSAHMPKACPLRPGLEI